MAKWFVSADEAIATVSEEGILHALSAGETTVAVYDSKDSTKKRGDIPITVFASAQTVTGTKVELNHVYASLVSNGPGSSGIQLKATITPSNATSNTINWTSSDPSVATVSNNGKVKAKSKTGSTMIRATLSSNPMAYAECNIVVTAKGTVIKSAKARNTNTSNKLDYYDADCTTYTTVVDANGNEVEQITPRGKQTVPIYAPTEVPAAGGWVIIDFTTESLGNYSTGITKVSNNDGWFYMKTPGDFIGESNVSDQSGNVPPGYTDAKDYKTRGPRLSGGKIAKVNRDSESWIESSTGVPTYIMDPKNCSYRVIVVKPNTGTARNFSITFRGTGTGDSGVAVNFSQRGTV